MERKKTVIVNESGAHPHAVQKMFSRGVMGLAGRRPAPARWAFVGGTLAQPQLVGGRK